jgi:hypothetical protein
MKDMKYLSVGWVESHCCFFPDQLLTLNSSAEVKYYQRRSKTPGFTAGI